MVFTRSRVFFKNLSFPTTIKNYLDGSRGKKFSIKEAAGYFLERAGKEVREKGSGALLHINKNVVEEAAAIEKKAQNELPLYGLPVIIKDNICTEGMPTTCASKILEDFVPPYDAHVVQKLRDAGAVILGKANMDEFAFGSSSESSAFVPVRNPVDKDRVPGGSSGGSAAAVALELSPGALGSDTGGSIRQPASFCGVVGLKPTYGRVSRYGLVAFGSSLDQIGPLARDVEGTKILFDAIAGHDPRDSTSLQDQEKASSVPGGKLKIGVVPGLIKNVQIEVREAYESLSDKLQQAGAKIEEISLPHSQYAVPTYYVVGPAEASSNLGRFDGVKYGLRVEGKNLEEMYCRSRGKGFGAEVKRRILIGTYVLSSGYYDAYYLRALKVRRLIKEDYDKAFGSVDLVLSPTAPTTAFKIGEKQDPIEMYLSDIFTISANLAGLPAISIPFGKDNKGLPIGMQFTAPPLREDLLFHAGTLTESLRDEW